VLEEACRQLARWRHANRSRPPQTMWVNLSATQLKEPGLAETVGQILAATGVDVGPDQVGLEVTESVVMDDVEASVELLRRLNGLGLEVAVDDFGTGYSSLSYLRRLPIDILKIDRSFVARLTSADNGPELARAVITLGETLGLDTVAEGIELDPQVGALLALGCVAGQGFLFA